MASLCLCTVVITFLYISILCWRENGGLSPCFVVSVWCYDVLLLFILLLFVVWVYRARPKYLSFFENQSARQVTSCKWVTPALCVMRATGVAMTSPGEPPRQRRNLDKHPPVHFLGSRRYRTIKLASRGGKCESSWW